MRLVREQDDLRRPLHHFVEGDARISRIARPGRPWNGLAEIRRQRIHALAIREDVLPAAEPQGVVHERLPVDRHQRVHPDGHEGAQRALPPQRRLRFLQRRVPAPQKLARVRLEDLRQAAEMRDPFRHRLGERDEDRQAELRQLLEMSSRILLLVCQDQVREQPRDRVHVRVLRTADEGDRLRRLAVSRAPDETVAGPEGEHVQRVARHQRDDAPRGPQEDRFALAVVGDPEGGHGATLHSKSRPCAPSS